MSAALVINLPLSLLRSTINGDNAVNPASQANVTFDGFGGKIHGVSQSGIVSYAAASGPTTFNDGNPQAVSENYYAVTVNFPETLDYVPFIAYAAQWPDGHWEQTYQEDHVTYYNSGGIMLPQGSASTTGALATQSYVLLYYKIINFVNPISVGTPLAFSYRIFGV